MHVQYVADHTGKPTGVFIPIKEWEKLKKIIINPQEKEPNKNEILSGIRKSLEEVELHLKGKIKLQNAKDFINEF